MKITKVKILNSPIYDKDAIIEFKVIEQHLEIMYSIMGIQPIIVIIEVEFN